MDTATGVQITGTRVRICLVAPSTDILGGQAVQAVRLLERLRNAPGIDITFIPINPRLPGPLRGLQRIKFVRTLVTETLYIATLLVQLRKCDVAHVFSASYFSFLLAPTPAIILSKLFGKKVILNYRSGEAEDHLRRWSGTALPTLRLVDEVVVPSGYLVAVFAKFGIRARSIFNIVDFGRFKFRVRDPLRPVFLANRNLEPMYNVGCVLRAFALIQQRFPAARLTVAGDGSQRTDLEMLATDLGLRHVNFLGRVAPERMGELYDQADIYLNASEIDNMPGSIIEAFAAGLPVVTTRAGGIPYIVSHGKTGLLVDLGDYEAMAHHALHLLDDPELASALILQAHDECRANYNWDVVQDKWLRLYETLAYAEGVANHAGVAWSRRS
jgi:glycosyltransferase involved in cell wall biosynthesis